ncbi:MAG TPA: hypothetical protein DFK21_17090 [Salmonella bongori]|nr:hypothetical protein [Salmonella bongori]HBD16677.1 hypothetical protein [Salmonella bongori]HCI35161.1 hypothetical protein [Salmonella bongori]HCI39921.1 hypothetical protein [Salmonella bongori]
MELVKEIFHYYVQFVVILISKMFPEQMLIMLYLLLYGVLFLMKFHHISLVNIKQIKNLLNF